MKLLVFLPIFFAFNGFSQWNVVFNHPDHESAISVLNENTIVVTSDDSGKIHRSIDGGETWTFFQTSYNEGFVDVDFPSSQVGYVCGGSSFGAETEYIMKSIDGGSTWNTVFSNTNGDPFFYYFTKLNFLNNDTGFVAPMNGPLFRTLDGGNSFEQLAPIVPNLLAITSIEVNSNSELFVCAKLSEGPGLFSFSIYKSVDLGNSWVLVHSLEENGVSTIFFYDENRGYAVGDNGMFLSTNNAGMTWNEVFLSPFTDMTALDFTTPEIGYINNAGSISKTVNGGQSWELQNISPLTIIRHIEFANDTIGYALGDLGIYKTTNGGDLLGLSDNSFLFDLFPNPFTDEIQFTFDDKDEHFVQLMNSIGQIVYEGKVSFFNSTINTLQFNCGMYFVNIDGYYIDQLVKH